MFIYSTFNGVNICEKKIVSIDCFSYKTFKGKIDFVFEYYSTVLWILHLTLNNV